ncbi:hypothetical protein BOSEA31B_10822 [Hyphomicrobiales bacterium]|nr:hypothetical protein BOSEA31B_10822 [Hyphomicrobiales bacterium]CAH1700674.1 hypothetical protein BOSEA1005_20373 [Hyphomicrobiales bacterium]CAI0344523.1 hypothetical protein BO1005MUT1_330190 [Hyphomicrobiales bacterium]
MNPPQKVMEEASSSEAGQPSGVPVAPAEGLAVAAAGRMRIFRPAVICFGAFSGAADAASSRNAIGRQME